MDDDRGTPDARTVAEALPRHRDLESFDELLSYTQVKNVHIAL
jgi:hypothetical protein